jgi:adenylate kinase
VAERTGLILLGPPGAGKGTQAAAISGRFGIPHISTGDMLRGALAAGTEVGLEAKKYMDAGELVPDSVVVAIVGERLQQDDCAPGWLLDGFPRNTAQADALEGQLEKIGHAVTAVLYLKVPDSVVVERLSGRRLCRECNKGYHVKFMPPAAEGKCDACGGELFQRDDDREETIRQRLEVYGQSTAELVDYYGSRGLLREVDASGAPEAVGAALGAAVEEARGGS